MEKWEQKHWRRCSNVWGFRTLWFKTKASELNSALKHFFEKHIKDPVHIPTICIHCRFSNHSRQKQKKKLWCVQQDNGSNWSGTLSFFNVHVAHLFFHIVCFSCRSFFTALVLVFFRYELDNIYSAYIFLLTLLLAVHSFCFFSVCECVWYRSIEWRRRRWNITSKWKMNRVMFSTGFTINISELSRGIGVCCHVNVHAIKSHSHYAANHGIFYAPAVFNGIFLWIKLFIPFVSADAFSRNMLFHDSVPFVDIYRRDAGLTSCPDILNFQRTLIARHRKIL